MKGGGGLAGGTWFWAGALAIGELYGGYVFHSSLRLWLNVETGRMKGRAERLVVCLISYPNGLLGTQAFRWMTPYTCKYIVVKYQSLLVLK